MAVLVIPTKESDVFIYSTEDDKYELTVTYFEAEGWYADGGDIDFKAVTEDGIRIKLVEHGYTKLVSTNREVP